jgi:hypothetical protein
MLATRPATAAYFVLRRWRQNELTRVTTGSESRRCVSGSALSCPTANTSLSSSSAPTPPVSTGLPKGETSLFERIRLLESCGELSLAAAETVVTRHLATTTTCRGMEHSRPDVERAFRYLIHTGVFTTNASAELARQLMAAILAFDPPTSSDLRRGDVLAGADTVRMHPAAVRACVDAVVLREGTANAGPALRACEYALRHRAGPLGLSPQSFAALIASAEKGDAGRREVRLQREITEDFCATAQRRDYAAALALLTRRSGGKWERLLKVMSSLPDDQPTSTSRVDGESRVVTGTPLGALGVLQRLTNGHSAHWRVSLTFFVSTFAQRTTEASLAPRDLERFARDTIGSDGRPMLTAEAGSSPRPSSRRELTTKQEMMPLRSIDRLSRKGREIAHARRVAQDEAEAQQKLDLALRRSDWCTALRLMATVIASDDAGNSGATEVTGAQLERLATVLGVDPSRVAHCNSEEHYSSRFAPAIRASLNVVSALVAKQRGAQGGVRISVAVPATLLLTAGGQWHAALQLVSPHINADTLSTTANADPDDRLRSVALSIAGAGSWQAVMRLLASRTQTTSLTAMSKECALAALLGYPGDRDAFELYLRSGRRKYNSTGGDGPASAHMMVANWGTLKPLFVGADAALPTVIQFAALAMLLGSKRLSDSAETAAFRRNIAATVAVPMLEALAPAIASARRVCPNATRRTQAEADAELAAAACDRVVSALAVRRGEATHTVPGVAAHAEWCTAVALAAMTINHGFPLSWLSLCRVVNRARADGAWQAALAIAARYTTTLSSPAHPSSIDEFTPEEREAYSATLNAVIRVARLPRPCAWTHALAALRDMLRAGGSHAKPNAAAVALLCVADSALGYTRRCELVLACLAAVKAAFTSPLSSSSRADIQRSDGRLHLAPVYGAAIYGLTTRTVRDAAGTRKMHEGRWANAAALLDGLSDLRQTAATSAAAAGPGDVNASSQSQAEWACYSLVVAAAQQRDHRTALRAVDGDVAKCVGVLAANGEWAAAVGLLRDPRVFPTRLAVRKAAFACFQAERFEEFDWLKRELGPRVRLEALAVPSEWRSEARPPTPPFMQPEVYHRQEALDECRRREADRDPSCRETAPQAQRVEDGYDAGTLPGPHLAFSEAAMATAAHMGSQLPPHSRC